MSAMTRIDRCFFSLQKEREGRNLSFSLLFHQPLSREIEIEIAGGIYGVIVETYVSSGTGAKFHMILDRLTNVTWQILMVY